MMASALTGAALSAGLMVRRNRRNKKQKYPQTILRLVDEVDETKSIVSSLFYADSSFLNNIQHVRERLADIPDDAPLKVVITTHGGALFHCSRLIRLLRRRQHPYIAYVRNVSMSAGTIICLGAKEIVMMEDHSYLGKIDPQLNQHAMVHVLKAKEQIETEMNQNGKRRIVNEVTFSNRILMLEAEETMNELEAILQELELSPELLKNVKESLIFSALPHEHKFDLTACKALGLPVRAPTEEELAYFED